MSQKLFSLCVTLTLLTACTNTDMDMRTGYTQGNYTITSLSITGNDGSEQDAEFQQAKALLAPALQQKLSSVNKQTGTPVALTVALTNISLEINLARSWLIGDSYRLHGIVRLFDPASGQQINEDKSVYAEHGGSGGLLGYAVTSSIYDDNDEATILANDFAEDVANILYPPRQ